jgi:adenylate cyclase
MTADPVQRRLAAILAADVAGYSRLMGEDEEGTLAALTGHLSELIEPCIAGHRGRVVKTTGDGLLAEFASVVDAVKCAVAFQEGMSARNAEVPDDSRVAFRIGVNLGDVIVQDDDVFGEGVNVASRLEGLAEPGGICVSGTVFDQIGTKLDLAIDDLGPQSVKNIAAPVRTYRIRIGGAARPPGDMPTGTPAPDKPSIAVLPFDNLSGDPEQEYFSDGVAEDLITALSRVHSFFVTARNSSFSYKGKPADVRHVAAELGVRYVLEGSVRKAGNRIRLTAQLIDGATGNHVWAERYDREIGDVFDLQDEMTERIVGAIEPAISKAEIQRVRSKRTDSLDAWDLCQRGWWHRYRNRREDYVAALDFFRRALEKDPDFASALAGLADAMSYQVVFSFVADSAAHIDQAIRYGRRAVEIDDQDPVAHLSLGRAYLVGRHYEDGIRSIQNALRLNPYFAAAQYSLGGAYVVTGRFEEGIDAIRKFMALSPQDDMTGPGHARLAQAYLGMKDYAAAADNAEEAFRYSVKPNWPGKSYLVSALGHLGRAEWIVEQELPLSMAADCHDDYIDGLRKAGLPE